MKRRQDIDQIRGLAILLMIMVHAAATWTPQGASKTSVFALTIAGLGGLAAPLFVTVGGWVTVQSIWTLRKAIFRFVLLCLAQVLVNLCAPHLFEPFSPGVLSLFGILYLLAPLWLHIARNVYMCTFSMLLIAVLNWIILPGDASVDWNQRNQVTNPIQFVSHALLTGTYPVFPWIFFSMLGAALNIYTPSIKTILSGLSVGIAVSLALLVQAVNTNSPFAQPSGDAVLTFFPANTAFLVGATTGVLIFWLLLENRVPFRGLDQLGQLSLTLYVIHFVPLYIGHKLATTWFVSIPLVVLYTFVWWPLGVLVRKHLPTLSLENVLRKVSQP
tara:strand:+ start:1386 stop:2375 length:990 start_codon:yes stop_codon:yes gene_type:complete